MVKNKAARFGYYSIKSADRDVLPLGVAVMELRGAAEDLSQALTKRELSKLVFLRSKLQSAISEYYASKAETSLDSLAVREWINIGEDSIRTANAMLETAVLLLSSSIKLV